uniref:Uncharacterized protein n=1 Tax=Fagus sylvatica TaxID=28930 RepID=A0A2N9G8W4_FAGSY
MRGGRVGFIENRARLAQHHHARRMTVLRELWYCHVAVLSFHASSPSNPPRFPCAYPFLSDFRGQFWRSSGTQNGSCGISSESSRRPLSNDIKFARIGVRTRELWLPEVGVSELFLCTLSDADSGQTGDAIGEPRVPRRSRSHYLSNAPGLADQLVASRKDSAREGGSCAAYFCKVPDSRESELGLVRYGPANRVHRGVFGPFEGSFPIRIPADPDKFLAIREFHVVHGCVFFPMCPGSQINLLRVRKTLCASVATSLPMSDFDDLGIVGKLALPTFQRYRPCTEASLGSQDMILRTGGRRNVPYAKGGGQFDPVFGLVNGPVKPWSNLVNLGQTWSNLVKALQTLGNVSRTSFQGFLGKVDPSRAGNRLGQTSVKLRSTLVVITPFLPTGFSRVPARKAGRPGSSPHDPTKPGPYLGGNVCAEILSGPLQLGPRAKTLRQEVHFSYHMQLSDHQELLRSSRNLSQKMTPWHKERSNGLRSQDHILRTQARLCARPVPLENRVFLTRNKLIHKPGCVGKKTHSCTTWNSRIAKILSGSSRNPDRKTALKRTKNTPVASVRGTISHKSKLGFPQIRNLAKLGQICARTGTRFEKKRAGRKTRFSSRTAAFARRVFPARNKLIYEPGCVGKITTPATSWNSRFAESIPHLIGIFTGKVHENSSDTPTSGSHNSLIRTPIQANFVPLEKRTSRAFRR